MLGPAQPIEIPLLGLDQKTDQMHVEPGHLLEAHNVQFRNPHGLRKRNGLLKISAYAGGTRRLMSRDNVLMAVHEDFVDVRFGTDWTPSPIGNVSRFQLRREFAIRPSASDTFNQDPGARCCYCNGFIFVGTTLSTGSLIREVATGATFDAPGTIAVAMGTTIWCLNYDGSNLSALPFDTTTGAFGSTTVLATSLTISGCDVTVSASSFVTLWWDGATPTGTTVKTWDSTWTNTGTATHTFTGTDAVKMGTIIGDGSHGYVAIVYTDNGTVKKIHHTTDGTTWPLIAPLSGDAVSATAAWDSAGSTWAIIWTESAYYSNTATDGTSTANWYEYRVNSSTSAGSFDLGCAQLASRAFLGPDSYYYVWCCWDLNTVWGHTATGVSSPDIYAGCDPHCYLYRFATDFSAVTLVGYALRGYAANPGSYDGALPYTSSQGYGALPEVCDDGSGNYYAALVRRFKAQTIQDIHGVGSGTLIGSPIGGVDSERGIDLVQVTADDPSDALTATRGEASAVAGAYVAHTGRQSGPGGLPQRPPQITACTDTVTSSFATSTVNYCITWEKRDRDGLLHRSAPSTPTEDLSVDSTHSAFVCIPHLPPGFSDVRAAIWRLCSDGNFHFVAYAASGGTYAEIVDDASALSNEQLYVTGGIVANDGWPPASAICLHNDRMLLASADDDGVVWYSKPFESDKAPEFNEGLSKRVAHERIIALESLDTFFLAFTENDVIAVFGDGYDNLGRGRGLEFHVIAAGVGCQSAHSVVRSDAFVYFQGRDGMYKVDRSLAVHKAPFVDRILDSGYTVTGGLVRRGRPEVLFSLSGSSPDYHFLLYDELADSWATFGMSGVPGIASMVEANGLVYALDTSGVLYEESSGYIDVENTGSYGGTNVLTRVTTPPIWFSRGGQQRLDYVVAMLERSGAHGMDVSFGNAESGVETRTFSEAEITAMSNENLKLEPRQKESAGMFVQLQETAPAASGGYLVDSAGPHYESLVFWRRMPRGSYRVPQGQRL